MKTYVYASAVDRDLSFRKNQVRTMFSALKPDLVTTLLSENEKSTVQYDSDVKVKSIYFMEFMCYKPYVMLKDIIKDFDIVVIQSYGCRVLGQNATAYEVFDKGMLRTTQYSSDAERRNAYRSWTVAAHIKACIELKKPFILYTFDPMIDSNYGITRMHGFAETEDMRYIPFMESGVLCCQIMQNKPLMLVYSAKFSVFDFKADGRKQLHSELSKANWPRLDCHVDVETVDGRFTLGEQMQYNEDAYLQEVAKAKYTICPPNYDGRCYSVKRAVEALKLGTLPLFLGDVKDDGLSMCWRHVIDLQNKYNITSTTISNILKVTEQERKHVIVLVITDIAEYYESMYNELSYYMLNWNKFKHEYASFAY